MHEIFTLSIVCVGGMYLEEEYAFVTEAPVDATLSDLASLILKTVAFDSNDHLDAFYLGTASSGRQTSLNPDGDWDDDARVFRMTLSEVFPLPKNKKLYYLYDFGASWRFQITKRGKATMGQPGVAYPRIVSETGVKPKEYGEDEDDD